MKNKKGDEMQNVKIKEIADELGIKPIDVLQKAMMMSINIKSIKSSVSVADATKIRVCLSIRKKKKSLPVANLVIKY